VLQLIAPQRFEQSRSVITADNSRKKCHRRSAAARCCFATLFATAPAGRSFLALPHLPPSLDASQSLELRAEVASLETESDAPRQQNWQLAARILQLQVTRASVLSIPFSCLIRFFPTMYSRRRKLPARTCLKKRCGCIRGWTRCRSSAGAPAPLPSCRPIEMSHQSFAVSFTVWCSAAAAPAHDFLIFHGTKIVK